MNNFAFWRRNGVGRIGVMECWSDGVMEELEWWSAGVMQDWNIAPRESLREKIEELN